MIMIRYIHVNVSTRQLAEASVIKMQANRLNVLAAGRRGLWAATAGTQAAPGSVRTYPLHYPTSQRATALN